jgi:hypothetical protein
LYTSCQWNEFDESLIFDLPGKFQYQKETAFCQSNPDKEIWSKTFIRDKAGNVIEETTFNNGLPDLKKTWVFNSNNQKENDSTFYNSDGNWIFQYSHEYIYQRNRLTEIIRYEPGDIMSHKTTYKYDGNNPRWEEFWYFSNNEWKFQYAHGFEFNNNGKLVKKESYQTEKKDKVYDTFIYKYFNNKLVEEKRIIQTGIVSYVSKFTYTSNGFPDETIQNGNVIEKNYYSDGRLTEKHTFYFGIDPGFSQSNGNLIYKYEY